MADETVPVVDSDGRVTGQILKSEAHRTGTLHPTILAEVIGPDGRWLLVKQSSDRQDAGQYVSPVGGHIRAGESETDALKREAAEELGISGFRYKKVGQAIFNREVIGRKENHLFILYEIYSDAEPTLNHESENCRRFTVPELKKEMQEHPELFGDAWRFVVEMFYGRLFL